jgi:hypothetical protein
VAHIPHKKNRPGGGGGPVGLVENSTNSAFKLSLT